MRHIPPFAAGALAIAGSNNERARADNLTKDEMSAIGRMGGLVGGQARAKALSSKRRREIAQKAAAARWGGRQKTD